MYERLRLEGQPTPLDDPVQSTIVSEWYLSAFRVLSNARTERNAIAISDIAAYMDIFEIIGTKAEFVLVIQALDNKLLESTNKE